jgi:microcystin-dependent protein
MSCNNCFNGCADIVSDKCVKYTGIDIPFLGITNGDTLLHVEEALINFLVPAVNGTGIFPNIDKQYICDLVNQYLPSCSTCTTFTLNDILTALVRATCSLQLQVNSVVNELAVLNAPYSIECLTGVTTNTDTHDMLQAVINKVCSLQIDIAALTLSLTAYVKQEDLNALIQGYINSSGQNTLIKNRMVPNSAVPYYGPTIYFNGSGAGIGDWDRIFLCNGNNGTPDLRGRTLVGATDGSMLGNTMNSTVNPATAGNPLYALGTVVGDNTVTLNVNQIPAHTHTSTTSVTDPGHTHGTDAAAFVSGFNRPVGSGIQMGSATISSATTGISVNVDIGSTGGGLAHSNIQPSIGCRYIIYIP